MIINYITTEISLIMSSIVRSHKFIGPTKYEISTSVINHNLFLYYKQVIVKIFLDGDIDEQYLVHLCNYYLDELKVNCSNNFHKFIICLIDKTIRNIKNKELFKINVTILMDQTMDEQLIDYHDTKQLSLSKIFDELK